MSQSPDIVNEINGKYAGPISEFAAKHPSLGFGPVCCDPQDCCNGRPENTNNEIYIGAKVIKAKPMDLVTFKKVKGENYLGENMPGYQVEYEDGYKSWSPKDTFERCYRLLSQSELHLIHSFLL